MDDIFEFLLKKKGKSKQLKKESIKLMPTNKTSVIRIEDKDGKEIVKPDFIKSEVNFLIYPFAALSKKGLEKRTKTEYRKIIKKKTGEIEERLWKVSANTEYGYPGPSAAETDQAITWLINDHGFPIKVIKTSIHELSKIRGEKKAKKGTYSGAIYQEIKKDLLKLKSATIEVKSTFKLKGKKEKWLEGYFNKYDGVFFKGDSLPDSLGGEKAECLYIVLSDIYFDNIKNFYTLPLNWKYQKSLSLPSRKLYGILTLAFNSAFRQGEKLKKYEYLEICQLLPLDSQKYFSRALQQLNKFHDELKDTGFLSKYTWSKGDKIKSTPGNWIITYYPGPRYFKDQEKDIEIVSLQEPDEKDQKKEANLQADELVKCFHKSFRGIDQEPTNKELKQAAGLINKHGLVKSKYIIDYAMRSATETNFQMTTFGAILQYQSEAIENYEKAKRIKLKRKINLIKQEVEFEVSEELKRAEEEFLENLPKDKREEIEKEIGKELRELLIGKDSEIMKRSIKSKIVSRHADLPSYEEFYNQRLEEKLKERGIGPQNEEDEI